MGERKRRMQKGLEKRVGDQEREGGVGDTRGKEREQQYLRTKREKIRRRKGGGGRDGEKERLMKHRSHRI